MSDSHKKFIFSFGTAADVESFRYFLGSQYGTYVEGKFEAEGALVRFSLSVDTPPKVEESIKGKAKELGVKFEGEQKER